MICMSTGLVITYVVCLFGAGVCVGSLITIGIMGKRVSKLETDCQRVSSRYEELLETQEMAAVIDDVPEYLRGKYHVPGRPPANFEEDETEAYI